MSNRHKYPPMRPRVPLVDRLSGIYPASVNVALTRYVHLISKAPEFSEEEWNVLRDACNGWDSQNEPPETLGQAFILQVEDAISARQLDRKWSVDCSTLIPRLYALSEVEVIAALNAIEIYWRE